MRVAHYLLLAAFCALLIYASTGFPNRGDAQAVFNRPSSPAGTPNAPTRYIQKSKEEMHMVFPALAAARKLASSGHKLTVVNARFAKPLDEDLILRWARPGRAVITIEEGITAGGFGSAVRELLDRQKRFDVKFLEIGLPMEIYPLGKREEIQKMFGLDAEGLARRIRKFLQPKSEQKRCRTRTKSRRIKD